ncbi:MAG: hypothetical protein ACT4P2_05215 [Pseudomonadota bacterium]
MNNRKPVAVGQRYVQAETPKIVWEVKALFKLVDDIDYARLGRVDDPSTLKTLSCESLTGMVLFRSLKDQQF